MTGRIAAPSVGGVNEPSLEEPMSTDTLMQSARTEIPGFGGRLVVPEDAGYADGRAGYNAMITRRPRLITRAADTEDVAGVIAFADRHDLLLAVRGGAHNGAGLGTVDEGVVLDLSALKSIEVDPGGRTVKVGGGCTWGEVDAATAAHGL